MHKNNQFSAQNSVYSVFINIICIISIPVNTHQHSLHEHNHKYLYIKYTNINYVPKMIKKIMCIATATCKANIKSDQLESARAKSPLVDAF